MITSWKLSVFSLQTFDRFIHLFQCSNLFFSSVDYGGPIRSFMCKFSQVSLCLSAHMKSKSSFKLFSNDIRSVMFLCYCWFSSTTEFLHWRMTFRPLILAVFLISTLIRVRCKAQNLCVKYLNIVPFSSDIVIYLKVTTLNSSCMLPLPPVGMSGHVELG